MKRFSKILIVVVIMALLVTSCFALVACKNPNYLYVATNAEFPPFEYYDENGKMVGFDVELIQAVATEMGYEKVVFSDMLFDSVIGSVQKGQNDCGVAGLTINDERKAQVDFTDTYYTAVQLVLSKNATPFSSAEEAYEFLKGKKIATMTGYTGDYLMQDEVNDGKLKGTNAQVVPYTNGASAVQALKAGEVDAVVIDSPVGRKLASMHDGVYADTNPLNEEEKYAFAVKKGNAELLEKFNNAIKAVMENGTIDRLMTKYIN